MAGGYLRRIIAFVKTGWAFATAVLVLLGGSIITAGKNGIAYFQQVTDLINEWLQSALAVREAQPGVFWPLVAIPLIGALLPFIGVIYLFLTRRVRTLMEKCLYPEDAEGKWRAASECWRLVKCTRRIPTIEQARIWIEHYHLVPEVSGPASQEKLEKLGELAAQLRDRSRPRTIQVRNCHAVISKRKELNEYLDYISTNHLGQAETLCRVVIERGFLAPIFLLTGLIAAFKDDWDPIIDSYGPHVHTQSLGYGRILPPVLGNKRDLAAFRVFQFNCWLLWGPSIPTCTCSEWGGKLRALQFGFGDENNSIDLVLPRGGDMNEQFETIMKSSQSNMEVFASLAQIGGILKPAKTLSGDLGSVQKLLLGGTFLEKSKERLALEIKHRDDFHAGEQGEIGTNNFYYSAYIWVMFVICGPDGSLLFPHIESKSGEEYEEYEQNWQNLLPFFVHGNIADESTYRLHKRMLAHQVCQAMGDILSSYPGISLKFACAFDESACGRDIYWSIEGISIRTTIAEMIRSDARLQDQKIRSRIDLMARSSEGDILRSYSACHLPQLIVDYYKQLRAEQGSA